MVEPMIGAGCPCEDLEESLGAMRTIGDKLEVQGNCILIIAIAPARIGPRGTLETGSAA